MTRDLFRAIIYILNTISISELKTRPSKAVSQAVDYPIAVEKRNKVYAYLVGKNLFEKMISYIEDYMDKKTIEKTDFKKGRDLERVASELGI